MVWWVPIQFLHPQSPQPLVLPAGFWIEVELPARDWTFFDVGAVGGGSRDVPRGVSERQVRALAPCLHHHTPQPLVLPTDFWIEVEPPAGNWTLFGWSEGWAGGMAIPRSLPAPRIFPEQVRENIREQLG